MDSERDHLGVLRIGRFLVGAHQADGWLVTLVLAAIGGQSGVCELHVTPAPKALDGAAWARQALDQFGHLAEQAPPERPLTVVGIRGMPLGAMATAHREADGWSNEMARAHPGASLVVGQPGEWSVELSDVSIDGLRALTASRYVQLVQSGHPRPLQQLSDEFKVSVSGVRARLAQARRAGFLTKARKGVAGGALTEAGQAHLPPRLFRPADDSSATGPEPAGVSVEATRNARLSPTRACPVDLRCRVR